MAAPTNDFQSGKAAALNFLKGQVMKLSKGKAKPALVVEILQWKLKTGKVTNGARDKTVAPQRQSDQ